MTLQDEVASKIFGQVNIKWIIGVWTKKAANSKRGKDKRLQTYKEGCLCSGSYLCSRGLFPPDSCQMASDAPEPQMINKTTMLLLIYSGRPRPACTFFCSCFKMIVCIHTMNSLSRSCWSSWCCRIWMRALTLEPECWLLLVGLMSAKLASCSSVTIGGPGWRK